MKHLLTETNQHELLQLILHFISTIIWPLTITILLLIFRKQIVQFLKHTKKVKLPGGVSLEKDEAEKEE